jgi:von Willebrand factor type A domain
VRSTVAGGLTTARAPTCETTKVSRIAHRLLGMGAAGSIAAALLAAPTGATAPGAHAAACTKATNIEAIIDDSGSMAVTDRNRLRVQGLDLLINTLSSGTFLGAVEFGGSLTPAADTVFKPEAVGPNAAAMKNALDAKIAANNGTTDYNAAFAQSDADNPNASARIFLTDGGHNEGAYNNGHLVHRVPTYVIGFSAGIAAADQQRLKTIAGDTGGIYFPQTDSSKLQSVMNSIGAALTCQAAPRSFTDQLTLGSSRSHTLPLASGTKSAQIALTWSSPLDRFTLSGLRLIVHGKTVAVGSRVRVRRLTIKRTSSPTFTVLKISGLQPGRLQFKVRATRVGSGAPRVTLTTQVRQSRSR